MYVLGLSAYSHEACAALLHDGRIVAVVEEERLNREKHTFRYPAGAIAACLRIAGIGIAEVDHIAFFWQPIREIADNLVQVARTLPGSLRLLTAPSGGPELRPLRRLVSSALIGREIARQFGLRRAPRVAFVEHHLAHAASAFHLSGFDEAAILTADGRGESTSTLLAVGRGKRIHKLVETRAPHSLGHLYAAVTDHLGFSPFSDEWKVMGMAAYGSPALVGEIDALVRPRAGRYELDLRYFDFPTHGSRRWLSERFHRAFGPKRVPGEPLEARHFDLAFALQRVIEQTGVALARHLHALTGLPNLCLAGGLALNVLMNRAILLESPFERLFVQPMAGDSGAALGAALLEHHARGGPRAATMEHAYLGPAFGDGAIESTLRARDLRFRRSPDIAREVAAHVAADRVVGWFQGRMEAGPRALGNRSLLASPTKASSRDRLNARVKRRESFRPFAPSVMAERAAELFDLPKGHASPFMLVAADVRPDKRALLPAVTHADGTARVHAVRREDNPRFWSLLAELDRLTGVPVVLNTSFNENEPIVCTPAHAADCFLRTEIDVLAIGDYLVERCAPVEISAPRPALAAEAA
ncbi:MAG: carbamoyltransferase C-terminal domain-containing protein [Byssovorax sp.]